MNSLKSFTEERPCYLHNSFIVKTNVDNALTGKVPGNVVIWKVNTKKGTLHELGDVLCGADLCRSRETLFLT